MVYVPGGIPEKAYLPFAFVSVSILTGPLATTFAPATYAWPWALATSAVPSTFPASISSPARAQRANPRTASPRRTVPRLQPDLLGQGYAGTRRSSGFGWRIVDMFGAEPSSNCKAGQAWIGRAIHTPNRHGDQLRVS